MMNRMVIASSCQLRQEVLAILASRFFANHVAEENQTVNPQQCIGRDSPGNLFTVPGKTAAAAAAASSTYVLLTL